MKAGNIPENIKISYSTAVITTLDEKVALQAVNLNRQQEVQLGLSYEKYRPSETELFSPCLSSSYRHSEEKGSFII